MEAKATPCSYPDWMLIFVAAQALLDLYTPNGTFGATVALACACVGFRFIHYLAERIAPIAHVWGGQWAAVIVMTLIYMAGIWFVPDAVMYVVRLSGR